jgi:hypothetical protein
MGAPFGNQFGTNMMGGAGFGGMGAGFGGP